MLRALHTQALDYGSNLVQIELSVSRGGDAKSANPLHIFWQSHL